MTRFTRTAFSGLAVVVLSLSAAPAFAEGGSGGTSGRDSTRAGTETEHQAATETEHPTVASDSQRKETETNRLERLCTNKRRVVGNTLDRIARRGQKQIDVFTKIADRTQKFKEDNNLTVADYDSLVAAVNDKKTVAETTVNKIKADAEAGASLSCDPGQPRSVVGGFRDDLKAEKSALKAYKTAIKNLIVAVKSAKSSAGEQQ